MASLFVIQSLHLRLRNGSNSRRNSETNGVGNGISVYDDVDIRTTNLADNSSLGTQDKAYEQSIYQELNMNRVSNESS